MPWWCARRTRMPASALDAAPARAMPGVRLVLTGEDIAGARSAADAGRHRRRRDLVAAASGAGAATRCVTSATRSPSSSPTRWSRRRDAAEALEIEWQPLPHVVGAVAALETGAPQVWPKRPGNLAFEVTLGERAATAARFRSGGAHRVAHARQPAAGHQLSRHPRRGRRIRRGARPRHADARQPGQPRHPRHACRRRAEDRARKAARGDARRRRRLRHQAVHLSRIRAGGARRAAAQAPGALDRRAQRAFPRRRAGPRQHHHRASSRSTTRAASSRSTSTSSPTWARICRPTRPTFPFSAPACRPASTTSRPASCACARAYTNTVPVDAYRGAGRPEAAYVIERLVDAAARELDVAPDALRRRNFIKPKAMPYATATGKVYDTGDFAAHMARAQELARLGRLQEARGGGQAQGAASAASGLRPTSKPAARWGRTPRR